MLCAAQADINRKGKSIVEVPGSGGGGDSGAVSGSTMPTSERRRRRKVKHEPLQDADEGTDFRRSKIAPGGILG